MINVQIYGCVGVLGVRCIPQMYLITTTVHRAYVYTLSLPTIEETIALIRHTYCTPYMFNPWDKKRGYVRLLAQILAQNQVRLLLVALFSCRFPIHHPPTSMCSEAALAGP